MWEQVLHCSHNHSFFFLFSFLFPFLSSFLFPTSSREKKPETSWSLAFAFSHQPQSWRESQCWRLGADTFFFFLWWRTQSSRRSMTFSKSPLRKTEAIWSCWRQQSPLTQEVVPRTQETHWTKAHWWAVHRRRGDLNFLITGTVLPLLCKRGKKILKIMEFIKIKEDILFLRSQCWSLCLSPAGHQAKCQRFLSHLMCGFAWILINLSFLAEK